MARSGSSTAPKKTPAALCRLLTCTLQRALYILREHLPSETMAGGIPVCVMRVEQGSLHGGFSETVRRVDKRNILGFANRSESACDLAGFVIRWKARVSPFLRRQFDSRRDIENYQRDSSQLGFLLHFAQKSFSYRPCFRKYWRFRFSIHRELLTPYQPRGICHPSLDGQRMEPGTSLYYCPNQFVHLEPLSQGGRGTRYGDVGEFEIAASVGDE